MAAIKLRLLGGFQVEENGVSRAEVLSHSPKGVLLMQYLILNRGRMETTAALTALMWPDSVAAKPESALKTLISRFRNLLEQVSPALGACLRTVRGGYLWESQIGVHVDVEEFLSIAEGLRGTVTIGDQEQQKQFRRMMELYQGRLLCDQEQPEWMKQRADMLHGLYLDVVEESLSRLEEEERFSDMVSVCRQALDADPLNGNLNMRLMEVLTHTGRESDAVRRYHYASGMQQSADSADDALDEYYTRMLRTERDLQGGLMSLKEELLNEKVMAGALVCDRSVFGEMFHLLERSLARTSQVVTLGVMMLTGMSQSPWQLDAAIAGLIDVLRTSLRRGDVVTRLNATQVALLLPMANPEDAGIISDRVKRAFYLQFPASGTLNCAFTIINVGQQRKE